MAVLTDLPLELLENIYHNLTSIDDVHYLARCCTLTYKVIQKTHVYNDIMRSVIRESPAHRYDIQLSRLLSLHREIVIQGRPLQPTPVSSNTASTTSVNLWEHALLTAIIEDNNTLSADTVTDQDVYEILARWQGLRELQYLWLTRQLTKKDYLSVNYTADTDEFIHAFERLNARREDFQEGERASRVSPEAEFYVTLDSDQRGRFHAAVTSVWLLNEMRWILTNFIYPPSTFAVPLAIMDQCKEHLAKQTQNVLLDNLDRSAMHSFLYHHLLPLHSLVLGDQNSYKLPLTFPLDLDQEPAYCTRLLQVFLVAGQTYLQPPDIIDLVVRDTLERRHHRYFRLPDSTERYIRSTYVALYPANYPLSATGAQGFRLNSTGLTNLVLFQRSTIAQCCTQLAPRVRGASLSSLFTDPDITSEYLAERALVEFDKYENRDSELLDIRNVFEKNWKTTRWMIWWWAGSEDKVRAKMERWRRE